jgi:hypothetical protein
MKRIVMRVDVKRFIKDSKFWNYFPEYEEKKHLIKSSGCCNMSEETYQMVLSWIQGNPQKWKRYLGCEEINIFVKIN